MVQLLNNSQDYELPPKNAEETMNQRTERPAQLSEAEGAREWRIWQSLYMWKEYGSNIEQFI